MSNSQGRFCTFIQNDVSPPLCLKFCLCLRNIRHFLCFQIHLKEENAWNLKRQPLSARWNTDPLRLKKLTAEREDAVPMARLFDMDY